MVLGFLAVDNFDFTRNIVKKILSEKLVKILGGVPLIRETLFTFKLHSAELLSI